MKAMVLSNRGPVESTPLAPTDVPIPEPGPGEVLVRISVCGICRTDLHVIEGQLAPRLSPVIPGHQIVGVVERCASGADVATGARVGVAWLHGTCGECVFCRAGRENLCDRAHFTGHSVNGGFAEFTLARTPFVYSIPDGFADLQAAPLLCAGIIGFRCLRTAGVQAGMNLGFYGFGAAAHVAIQVARHWGAKVFVCSRDIRHQNLAKQLGAAWAGGATDRPPVDLDAAIIFAPAGELVPVALACLTHGGVLVLGGIHMSDIPSLPYQLLYGERVVRSVMNNTRADGRDFLKLAAEIPIRPEVEEFSLAEANQALIRLKNDAVRGAAVLRIRV